jgi:hypothetical protein
MSNSEQETKLFVKLKLNSEEILTILKYPKFLSEFGFCGAEKYSNDFFIPTVLSHDSDYFQ